MGTEQEQRDKRPETGSRLKKKMQTGNNMYTVNALVVCKDKGQKFGFVAYVIFTLVCAFN